MNHKNPIGESHVFLLWRVGAESLCLASEVICNLNSGFAVESFTPSPCEPRIENKAVCWVELVFVLSHLRSLFPESLSRIVFLSVHLQKPSFDILLSLRQPSSLPHLKTLMLEHALD